MGKYIKNINGSLIVKTRRDIVVKKDGMTTYNPTEKMILEDGWEEYKEDGLKIYKEAKLKSLERYDKSKSVNDCIIVYQGQEFHYWANKDERNDLKNAIRDCIAMGRKTYRLDLRDLGVSIVAECEGLLQMMAALEVYAIDCFNKTTDHRYAILAKETVDDVRAYKFRDVGYPEIPRFEL